MTSLPRPNRVPTERQYLTLRGISFGAGLSFSKRVAEPLLKHGWVTADWAPPYYQWVRITPHGLRALALAVERYGLPELHPKTPAVRQRECADCGSRRYRFVAISAEEAIAA